jgi:hypothetical protein
MLLSLASGLIRIAKIWQRSFPNDEKFMAAISIQTFGAARDRAGFRATANRAEFLAAATGTSRPVREDIAEWFGVIVQFGIMPAVH